MRRLGAILLAASVLLAAPASAAVPGAVDGGYGRCGTLPSALEDVSGGAVGMATLPGGGLLAVAVGSSSKGAAIGTMRLTADGARDTAYGSGGTARAALPKRLSFPRLSAVAVQPTGGVVVAGATTDGGFLARLNPAGSLDASFGSRGVVVTGPTSGLDVDPAGRLLVAGARREKFAVTRFSADGAPDPSFGTAGTAVVAFAGTSTSAASAVRVGGDGTILAGGQADRQPALARLLDNGTLDPASGTRGTTLGSPPAAARIDALALLPDGGIVAAGQAENINGMQQAVGRFTAGGALDAGFGRGGFALSRAPTRATQIATAADGTLLVAGDGFARYTATGAPDRSFGVRGALPADGTIGGFALLPDGAALAAVEHDSRLAVTRFALGGAALSAVADQAAICGPQVYARGLESLVAERGLEFIFTMLEPGRATWTATARTGGRMLRLGRTTTTTPDAGDLLGEISLRRNVVRRLRRARSAHITLTGRDAGGHSVTVEGDLRR